MLTVGVGPTFAMRWLIPRLADFQKTAPDIEVRFATGGAALPFNDDWTCGIRLGDGDWPGFDAEQLFAADLTPVCAPALAQAAEDAGRFEEATLLRVAHARGRMAALVQGGRLSKIRAKGPEFEYYGQALQAAADGVGVAMGISPYIDDDLDGRPAGRAVRAVGPEGRALVSDLSRGRKRRSGVRGVPRLDPARRAPRADGYCGLAGIGLAARRVGVGHALRHEGSCARRR